MTKKLNSFKNIITVLIALLLLGLVAGHASAATATSSSDGNALIPAWETGVVIANGTQNLTIGFNTLNASVSNSDFTWNIDITNPSGETSTWIDIQVWNGATLTTASGNNNTIFNANSTNIANTTGFTYGISNATNYSAIIILRTTNSTVHLGGFNINVSNLGNTTEWAKLSNLNFTAGPLNAATSSIVNGAVSKVANGSDKMGMTLALRDAYSNPILSLTSGPTISASNLNVTGTGTVSDTSSISQTTGNVTFNVTATVAGAYNVSALANSITISNNTTIFTAGPANKLAIFGPDSVTGVININQTVVLQDANGNNVTDSNAIGPYTITTSKVSGSGSITSLNPFNITNVYLTNLTALGVNYSATYENVPNLTITAGSVGAGAFTFKVSSNITSATKTVTFYNSIDSLSVTTNETSMHANNGNDSLLVTVQLKDVNGNNVQSPGVTIQLGSNLAGLFNTADIAATNTTNANGVATFVVRSSSQSGSDSILGTVIVNPAGGTGQSGSSSAITLLQAPYPANSAVVISSASIYTGTNTTITATIKDYNGTGAAIAAGYPVRFNITTGDATFANNGLTVYTATADGTTGNATALITSINASTANSIIVNVTIDDENSVTKQIGSLQTFTVTPGTPTQFVFSPGASAGLTNVIGTTQRFNITVKDSVGNLNYTASGTINITTDNQGLGNMSNGTTTGVLNNLIVTMTNGNASFNYTVNSSTVGTAVLTLNSSLGIADATVTITTSGAAGIGLIVDNSVQDINSGVLALAQLTDAAGVPLSISGTNIGFVVKDSSNVIQLVSTNVTNSSGIANFSFTRSTAGVYTVTASNTTLGLSNSTTVTFAGQAAAIVVTANNSTPLVNETVTINATVKDSSGITSGSLGAGTISFLANGTEFASATLSSGVASTTYTKSTAGAVTITAFFNASLQNTTIVTFVTEALPALTVTATPDTVTESTPIDVLFNVTSNGIAIDNATVTLGGNATGTGTTNASGLAIISVNATETGTITVTASLSGYTDGTATITAEAAPEPLVLTVTASPENVTVGVAENVTFTVTPALSDVLVTLSGAGVSMNGTTTNGTVTLEVTATSAGTILVTASLSGYTDGTTTITAEEVPTVIGSDTVGIYRTGGAFYLRNSNSAGNADLAFIYGITSDTPLVGDWDGNGNDTVGIYRNGSFYLKNSNEAGNADLAFIYGIDGDIPLVGDWNGDGVDTVGIYRDGSFYLRNSNEAGNADLAFIYGIAGDIPLVGDWNSDGVDTVGIYRDGSFYLRNSNDAGNADNAFIYGIAGDTPLVGDWTGIGTDTVGIYRDGAYYLRNSNDAGNADNAFIYGIAGDTPIVGNWDGQ